MQTVKTSAPETGTTHVTEPQTRPSLGTRGPRSELHIGNQAMLRHLSLIRPQLQCKLEIGSVSDPLEAEADRVADHVMRMPDPCVPATPTAAAGPAPTADDASRLQRKCSACQEEDEKLARKSSFAGSSLDGSEAPPIVHEALASPGKPLAPATRDFFEPRFGVNLDSIRVHTHELAGRSAQAVNAVAYTVGNHIVFADGQYAPGTLAGHRLLAHELAHTMQQTRHDGLASPVPDAPVVTSSPLALSRARVTIGNVSAQIDYGDIVNIPASGYLAAIQARYQSYTGAALDPAVLAQVTAFTSLQQEWVLFALDVLSENTPQAPGLNRVQAFQRVVDRAPSSTTRALGTASHAFEREVLVTSGWAENAISGGLTAPTAAQLTVIDPLLNPPPDVSAPPGGVFDSATFNTELPGLTQAVLTSSKQNPANWPATRAQPLADVQSAGDVIQAQALTFFAPYAETARDNRWLAGWQYSTSIFSVTTDPGGGPRTISRDERLSLISNRANIAGRDDANGPSLFSRTNFDPGRSADAAAFDAVVAGLETSLQSLVDDLARHTGQQDPLSHTVGISTEVSTATPECTTRWSTIRTLCHELMHAMAHPDFFAAASSSPRFPSGITFDQVLIEGFAEVLGVQLFKFLRQEAAGHASLRNQLTQGVTGTCTPPTTPVTVGYAAAGANAQTILGQVGDDRFRAAYFHGRVSLIGL